MFCQILRMVLTVLVSLLCYSVRVSRARKSLSKTWSSRHSGNSQREFGDAGATKRLPQTSTTCHWMAETGDLVLSFLRFFFFFYQKLREVWGGSDLTRKEIMP